jgi:hypothetical protein
VRSRCSTLGRLIEHGQMQLIGKLQGQAGVLAWSVKEIGGWWRDGSGWDDGLCPKACQGWLRAREREREGFGPVEGLIGSSRYTGQVKFQCTSLEEQDMREGGRYMAHKCQCRAWLVLILAKRKWTKVCPKRVVLDVQWVVLVLVYFIGNFRKC